MDKKTIVSFYFIFTVCMGIANAQYYNATHRQTIDEMATLKAQSIQSQVIYIRQAGNSIPYEVNNFDTGGRVILIANPKHHEHFTYDNNGRMNHWIDSANDGRRFEKFDYSFGYDEKGNLAGYRTKNTTSKFTATGQEVDEDVSRNGVTIEKHTYKYTNDNKLSSEVFKELTGKSIYVHRLFYNKYGDLASEITMRDCDSTTVINTYNNKGKIVHKQVNHLEDPHCAASGKKSVTESYSYTYNANGQLVTETMTTTDPGASYRKEYQYTMEGLPFKVLSFDDKGKSTSDLIYSYVYFRKKR